MSAAELDPKYWAWQRRKTQRSGADNNTGRAEDSSFRQARSSLQRSRRLMGSATSESLAVSPGTVHDPWRKLAENISAFSPGQSLADGLKNDRRGFLGPLPPTVPCSFFSEVGLGWVPGKGKKKLAGLVWGGEQMGTRDCPQRVVGTGNSFWLSLQKTRPSCRRMDTLRIQVSTLRYGCVPSQRELLDRKYLGVLVQLPGCP